MNALIQKLPFLIELIFNGLYILLYSLVTNQKIPNFIPLGHAELVLSIMVWFVPIVLLFIILMNYMTVRTFDDFIRRHVFSLIIFIPMVITMGDMEFSYWLASVHLLSSLLSLYDSNSARKRGYIAPQLTLVERLKLKPAQFVVISFLGVIFFGAFLLKLPVSSAAEESISMIDAFFLSTSATCVTGLSPLSLADNLSLFGQIVILVLIQVGGLGIMTLQSSMALFLGRSMGVKERLIMQDVLEISNMEDLVDMIIKIVKYTLLIELWGGIFLTIGFTMEGFDFGKAVYFGFFHSISAFCNAGFSLFNNSLENFSTTPLIHVTIAILIILGGLGFIVLRELKMNILEKRRLSSFGLHSKIVLSTTAILILVGMGTIFVSEYLNSLDSYSFWEKLQISFFQSVTLRTAGFNTVPISGMHSYTIYLMTLFMFIGASPGSTAGGIKTTTFAILIHSVRSTLRGSNKVEFFDRTIPNDLVVRATALTIVSLMTVSGFLFLLLKMEPDQSFLPVFFETVSAFGTVGLSLGLTAYLTFWGKFLIIIIMFIGRVGPMTLVFAVGQKSVSSARVDYPDGRLMIG